MGAILQMLESKTSADTRDGALEQSRIHISKLHTQQSREKHILPHTLSRSRLLFHSPRSTDQDKSEGEVHDDWLAVGKPRAMSPRVRTAH